MVSKRVIKTRIWAMIPDAIPIITEREIALIAIPTITATPYITKATSMARPRETAGILATLAPKKTAIKAKHAIKAQRMKKDTI